ncbi:EI24 domain-containing protein [Dechloromonas denitrificans]|uniref:EI24 domain-containing protein n=1 Tax=Dechloromonas denitrificans TaxID=281362 RepID=UPI001CF8961D|nr:EI24 domain-containing protein [Dechloromonas denitrificans]UCV11054.1 EI24 domain-containing protein [Dechloromonas denitrificans]
MAEVMLALMRTLASLRQGKIWAYVLLPALFSLVLSIGLAVWGLGALVEQMMAYPPMTFLVGWGLLWLAHILAYLGGWMAIFAVAYLTASLLAALLILPLMLKHLAQSEYQDVAPMGRDSFVAAAVNSIWASILFVGGWLVTLPLWLVPGFSLIVPMLLMAWLNHRTFAYDALSMHATDAEWDVLRAQGKGPMFMLGLSMALLAHLPVVGLLVPALAALSFIHYGLESLRRTRAGALVTIVGERI